MNFETYYSESVVSFTRSGLNPAVFELTETNPPILQPSIKAQIAEDLFRFRRVIPINRVLLIGSILTKNYSKDSDLDVTIEVNKEDIDQDTGTLGIEQITDILRTINGKLAVGTTHPINYYITTEFDEDNADAIYDLDTDVWIKEPSDTGVDIDGYLSAFQDLVSTVDIKTGQLRRDVIDYNELKELDEYSVVNLHTLLRKKLYEINKNIEILVDFKANLKNKRQQAFASPMTPQEILKYSSKNKLPANVVYKLFQRYYYLDLIKRLDEVISNRDKSDEYVDKIEDLIGYKESISFEQFMLSESVKKFDAGKFDWKNPQSVKKYKDRRYELNKGMSGKTFQQVPDIHRSYSSLGVSKKVVDTAKKAPSGIWRLTPLQVKEIAMKYHHISPNKRNPIKHLGNTGIVVWRKAPNLYYLVKHRNFGKKY